MRWVLSSFLLAGLIYSSTATDDEKGGPPPFFIQDPSDSLCLAGEEFKRCSIDTLFYVVGSPGKYQVHKRAVDGTIDEEDDGICLSKKSCKEADITKLMEAKLSKCSHCGAKNWNILGDSDTGYVLTEGDGKTCLVREKGSNKVMTTACDSEDIPYTPFQLQFASASDIRTMSSPGARMIGASSDGDKKQIQALLKEGIDVNVRDWDELTALIPAASSGHLEICKLLVKEGCDVNAKDKDGITALMEASIMGHNKIVEFLLDKKAEVDAVASSDVTALWLAASEGKTDVMKILLKKGADASNTRSDGITALMTAGVGGHAGAIELLLEKGADATATDKDGLTALLNAAENGTVPVIKLLAEHVNDPKYLDTISNTGYNALTIASAHGHADAIEYLIEAGADVSAVDENGVTSLMYAAASDHVEAMKVLIEKGKADVDFRHSHGGTALLEASTGGASNAVKLLLDKGASYDFTDNDGVTPLMAVASQGSLEGQTAILDALKKDPKKTKKLKEHINMFSFSGGSSVMFAAAGGHYNCSKQLIDLGADVNSIARSTPEYLEKLKTMYELGQVTEDEQNVDGVTAIHVAAQGGHLEVVELLIEAGADVTILDDESRSPLMLAVKGNYGEVAAVLVKSGADPNTPYVDSEGESHNLLFDAIMVENEEFAKSLIEKGADLYHKDEKKVTTLLQACHRGLTDIVGMLLKKHGGKEGYINDASEDGITPLIAASSEGQEDIVKMLVKAKTDINSADKDDTTALMAAAARGHLSVVTELLKAGADVNAFNADGHTALMFAYNGKNQVETLWERYNQFLIEAEAEKTEEEVDDGGTGPVIQEALNNHTSLIELLLKNGADINMKDKEGHAAKDFDFHSDTDAEVLNKEVKSEKIRDASKNEL